MMRSPSLQETMIKMKMTVTVLKFTKVTSPVCYCLACLDYSQPLTLFGMAIAAVGSRLGSGSPSRTLLRAGCSQDMLVIAINISICLWLMLTILLALIGWVSPINQITNTLASYCLPVSWLYCKINSQGQQLE